MYAVPRTKFDKIRILSGFHFPVEKEAESIVRYNNQLEEYFGVV